MEDRTRTVPGKSAAPGRRVGGGAVIRVVAVAAAAVVLVAIALPGLTGPSGPVGPSPSGAVGGVVAASPRPLDGLIAYTDARTATAWVIGTDGSDRHQIETDGPVTSAQLSPDGRRLVYARTTGDARGRIAVVNVGGGAPVQITSDPRFDDRSPAWSPDALAIVFARAAEPGGAAGLWVTNFDGSQPVQLTDPAGASHDQPSWSPDDTRIAFTVFDDGAIATIAPDCTGYSTLARPSTRDSGPVWSPDASTIAFTGLPAADSPTDVFAMTAVGHRAVNVTSDGASDHDPAWSPDGRQIAFVSNRTGDDEIWIADADGSDPRQLTSQTGHAFVRLSWAAEPPFEATPPPATRSSADPMLPPPVVARPIPEACPARTP